MSAGDLLMSCGFAVIITIWLVQMWFIYDFLRSLRLKFPQQWEQLGKPTLVFNNSLSNNWAVYRFLWRRDYIALGDEAFTRRCVAVRAFSIAALIAGVLWVAVVCAYIAATQKIH
jgi:hypothetical protein